MMPMTPPRVHLFDHVLDVETTITDDEEHQALLKAPHFRERRMQCYSLTFWRSLKVSDIPRGYRYLFLSLYVIGIIATFGALQVRIRLIGEASDNK